MNTSRRFVEDESGMTIALAMMMIVIVGVMGAGLLTFVSSDLNTVTEENRGQRAFEMADAGVNAAKHQLSSDCSSNPDTCPGHYDQTADDLQWSATKGGLTLRDLDGDLDPTDTVNVKITPAGTDSYKVISTGHYRAAQRKIEAIFKGTSAPATGGSDGIGHPIYYTPSDIKIASMRATTQDPVDINGLSLFSEQDIILESGPFSPADTPNTYTSDAVHNRTVFKNDMNSRNSGTTFIHATTDALCDWNSDTPLPLVVDASTGETCFEDNTGPWNDVGRDQLRSPDGYSRQNATSGQPLTEGGFSAQGVICGVPSGTFATTNSCANSSSVADGVYAYDCTTGNYSPADCPDAASLPRGNQLTFVDKDVELGSGGSNRPNSDVDNTVPSKVISYPFPRPRPIAKELYKLSAESTLCGADTIPNKKGCSYTGVPTTTTQWQKFWPNVSDSYDPTTQTDKVVFIDAMNSSTQIQWNVNNQPSNQYKGILVVWCGDLLQQSSFQGIILNIQGPGFTTQVNGNTVTVPGCGPDRGLYKNAGTFGGVNNKITCKCWVYANGGTASRAGIEIGPGSVLYYPPGRSYSFLNNAFDTDTPPPTTFALQRWRELYE